MGCGLSLCRKSKDRKSASSSAPGKPESPVVATDTSPLLSTDDKDAAAAEEAEELDDAEKELQRLADDHAEMNGSPPPTLGDSRTSSALSSERGVAPMPITAIATFKTLESPRSVIFTSSRPTSAEQHASPAAPNLDTNVEEAADEADENEAAIKIQAAYRGHRTRRDIHSGAATAVAVGVGAAVVAGVAAGVATALSADEETPADESGMQEDALKSAIEEPSGEEGTQIEQGAAPQEVVSRSQQKLPLRSLLPSSRFKRKLLLLKRSHLKRNLLKAKKPWLNL